MDHYIDRACLMRLLTLTFAKDKIQLLRILINKEMKREEKIRLVMQNNQVTQLINLVERIKMPKFWLCQWMIYKMMLKESKDMFLTSNTRATFKYWIQLLLMKLKATIKIARIPLKVRIGIELDLEDKLMMKQYYNLKSKLA